MTPYALLTIGVLLAIVLAYRYVTWRDNRDRVPRAIVRKVGT